MNVSLARKNLFHEKGRLIISVSGVAFAVMLILIILALYRGWTETLSAYIKDVHAEVWIMQKGTVDMSHSISLLPNTVVDELRSVEGVDAVYQLLGNRIGFEAPDGEEVVSRIVGFDTSSNIGKPIEMIEGSDIPKSGEIIIDELVYREHDIAIGSTLELNKKEFTVVGIAAGGPLFQQSYITIDDARGLFNMTDISNFFIIDVSDTIDTTSVISTIEETIPGVDAQTSDEFSENNEREIMKNFVPIIFMLVFIGFIVGLVIISLTIYTATLEKYREYGVVKAIGASNPYLYRVIITQSAISGALGYAVGIGLTYVVAEIARQIEPLFVTLIRFEDIFLVGGIVLLMILFATYIPFRRLMKLDPALVFKA